MADDTIHDEVRAYYRAAVRAGTDAPGCAAPCCDDACGDDTCCDGPWGAVNYDAATLTGITGAATGLSMGCGNPYAMADLHEGETVLDLGSGAGLDVILSAKRVGPTGKVYGLDFLDEMNQVARANAADAGVSHVEFLHGMIEHIPLPDATVDVVISNCVINLLPDKGAAFAEITRVLRPGGRVAISDVVADNGYRPPTDGDSWASCIAGAIQHDEYLQVVNAAGLTGASIDYTHEVGPGLHAAIIRAARP